QVSRSQTSHRGRWRLNKGLTKPSNVWFAADGSPAAWSVCTYNPGNAKYDMSQVRINPVDVGGGDIDYFATLYARVARRGVFSVTEAGSGNGVELYCPLGILGTRFDYQFKNPNTPVMARAVFGCRERSGEDWELFKEDLTGHSSYTAVAVAYYDLTTL